MAPNGPGDLAKTSGKMNSQPYNSIVEEVLMPGFDIYSRDSGSIPFVQDKPRFIILDWAKSGSITIAMKLGLLADLKPIENIWGLMVQHWDNYQVRRKKALLNIFTKCETVLEELTYII